MAPRKPPRRPNAAARKAAAPTPATPKSTKRAAAKPAAAKPAPKKKAAASPRVKCAGPECGKSFTAARSTARYCSATCRQRARRDRQTPKTPPDDPKSKAPDPDPDEPADPDEPELVKSTRLKLGDQVDTFEGQLALTLARRILIDPTGVSALAKELRAVVTAATRATDSGDGEKKGGLPDQVAEARRRRDAAREAAGRT